MSRPLSLRHIVWLASWPTTYLLAVPLIVFWLRWLLTDAPLRVDLLVCRAAVVLIGLVRLRALVLILYALIRS